MLLKPITLPFRDFKPELDRWKQKLGMEESFWFGRAATGLIAALNAVFAISLERKKVLIPALGCTTVANTVLLAGGEPVFVDVDPSSGVMDIEDLRKKIAPDCSAVVFVALYGNLTNPTPLLEVCRKHELMLIEDGAQALGSRWPDGTPLGGYGDFAVFSFNSTKILENGGGVLFCRSSRAAELVYSMLESRHFQDPEQDDTSGMMMRDLQMGMAEAMRNRIQADFSAVYVKTVFQSAHLYTVPWQTANSDKWLEEWKSLDDNLSHRSRMADLYLKGLRPDLFKPLTGKVKGAAVWRHSVLTPDRRFQRRAVATLRRNGFLASAHYWALPGYYTDQPYMCPNAVSVADRVLNLWVDSKVQEADVCKIIEILTPPHGSLTYTN